MVSVLSNYGAAVKRAPAGVAHAARSAEPRDPHAIAESIKRSAERSHRRKSPPYRSAMSMLVFYINRGGKNLSAARRRVLEQAKDELRKLFHRDVPAGT